MMDKHVQVNRAPVLTLWAAVVARRLGFARDESLTMGRVVAGLNAHAKGTSLGPVVRTAEGLRALSKDKPVDSKSVQRYLESKSADALPDVEDAMDMLAGSMSPGDLRARAYALYESFRPQIPAGVKGWGAAGDLDLAQIRRCANSTS